MSNVKVQISNQCQSSTLRQAQDDVLNKLKDETMVSLSNHVLWHLDSDF
jgi:hypothetical protein